MTERKKWDDKHRDQPIPAPEPFLVEMIPRIPRGLALDIAAGRGRHALAIARAGIRVIAVDFSAVAMSTLAAAARAERLPVWPVVANLDNFYLRAESFDAIVNLTFLDRALFPNFVRALRPGGILIADTFLIDQAASGHPRNPDFMLNHGELKSLVGGLQIEEYREGRVTYPNGTQAYRASIAARRPGPN